MKKALLAISLLLILASCKTAHQRESAAVHQDMRTIHNAFEYEDYALVKRTATLYADRGTRFVFAHYFLGRLYLEGLGVKQDTARGLEYLETASDKGQMHADYYLGMYYLFSDEKDRDYVKAREHLEQVLANKSSKWFKYNDQIRHPTMFLIGYIYENGLGLEGKDQKTAFEWYLRAANSGYSFAQYKIGEAYYFGHVYEVNHTFAESWLKLAADKEVADAMLLLAEMYNAGHGEEADKALAESYIERARMSKNKISTILRYQGAISND